MHRLLALPLTALLLSQLAVLGLGSIAWNAVALLLYPVLPRAQRVSVGRASIAYGYRLFWSLASAIGMLKLDARALDALRDEPGLILVANHPSLLDAPMLVARLPRSACIMKAGLSRNPLLGPGARLAGYIRNDSPRGLVLRAVEDLRRGGQLVVFPEGTRTTQAPINRFRPGVTLIARRAEAPIQSVFIETDSPYLGKGWPLWRLPPLPIRFSVRLGRRFAPQEDSEALLSDIERYFAAALDRASTHPPGRRSALPH